MDSYELLGGERVIIDRVMAWNVLTVLGDALCEPRPESRSEAAATPQAG